jgi:hypothetical protein
MKTQVTLYTISGLSLYIMLTQNNMILSTISGIILITTMILIYYVVYHQIKIVSAFKSVTTYILLQILKKIFPFEFKRYRYRDWNINNFYKYYL